MIARGLLISALATYSATAAAADPASVLGNVAEQMRSDARSVSSLLVSRPSSNAVTRQYSRSDGVYFFVLMPGFKDQVTVDAVMDIDAFADRAFRRLDAEMPKLGKIAHFQGFRMSQYRDGTSGITYAALIPRDRYAEPAVAGKSQSLKTISFCESQTAPTPPRSHPVNENDNYAEETAGADANGIWYNSRWAFEALACPQQGCNPPSPTGYVWTIDNTCQAQDPQPAQTSPPTPSPPATGSMGGLGSTLFGITPVIIAGNVGMGWTFHCSYGGEPIPCGTP